MRAVWLGTVTPRLFLLAWLSAALLVACASVPDMRERERERTRGRIHAGYGYKDLYKVVVPAEGRRADSIYTLELAFTRNTRSECVEMTVMTKWVSRELAETGSLHDDPACHASRLWADSWPNNLVKSELWVARRGILGVQSRRKPGQLRTNESQHEYTKHASIIREWASAESAGATICGVDFELSDRQKARILEFLSGPPVPVKRTKLLACGLE